MDILLSKVLSDKKVTTGKSLIRVVGLTWIILYIGQYSETMNFGSHRRVELLTISGIVLDSPSYNKL